MAFFERYENFTIRSEIASDISEIRALNIAAFGQVAEADLVDELRNGGHFTSDMSLVVESSEGHIIGHALLSVIECITDRGTIKAGAIAPGAIAKNHRGFAVARRLMEAVIKQAKTCNFDLLILLARPKIYGRLGFSAEVAKKIESVYSGAGDAFMALELKPGVITDASSAKVHYPPPFAKCDG